MPNKVSNSGLLFLLNLLKATSQNQEINLLLDQNLDKLNNDFACLLREWAIDQFKNKPDSAINIAKVIFKFSNIIQKFELGNKDINLEIAITGYETSLKVCTYETSPIVWANLQQALSEAYQQRQHILSNTIVNLIEQHQSYINSLSEKLPQELKQTQLEVEQLTKTLTQLKAESVNLAQSEDIKNLMADYHDIKQSQKIINNDYLLSTKQHFNTAVFYDIENLTMGRSNPSFNFSLKLIQDNIKKTNTVKEIALQYAYADWSDSRLKSLRTEIQELGIQPVQIFDFGPKKNAADIQLAIDVTELITLRPSLQVFVIVSGDGGFASLANKLHEYGKTVIGCAYEEHSNRFLKSVCDYFIPINNPQESITEILMKERNYFYVDIYIHTKEILLSLKNEHQFVKSGIPIPQVHTILKKLIPNFDERLRKEQNYKNLITFLKKAIEGTEICISSDSNKIILKESLSKYTTEASSNILVETLANK
ncbi:NYN domain-containing protein [Nostoc sp. FACHB-152]|uniref:NYN domain-containing protein n=1 Tax=unclassified Nostoc TaxID=2593658 RepID=UPI0016864B7D|nr:MULTISPECIES: NYN domain-containing protein [unclassified Nostoc]MBD2446305.1 NYN domain-containing protein [Nostoc sp. FACHB-152]MBD2467605.1 NYN domain-containing protein [Nostoc sp. FACHB-145]